MEIKQFRYASDNLGYLVFDSGEALAIDAGAVDAMTSFAGERNITINTVTNTHTHQDHTMGNTSMLHATRAAFLDSREFGHGETLTVGKQTVTVYRTPGHMDDCVTFRAGNALICGDTLFNGTVGTCFSGDMAGFLQSILFLMTFAPETLIYAGHDYVKESMAFARTIEKDNPEIDRYLAKYDPRHVVSTLADEFKANPFLRFNDPKMIAIMESRGLPVKTELERWNSLMDLY
jgi:hydroxyacylglutathione hydrolase